MVAPYELDSSLITSLYVAKWIRFQSATFFEKCTPDFTARCAFTDEYRQSPPSELPG